MKSNIYMFTLVFFVIFFPKENIAQDWAYVTCQNKALYRVNVISCTSQLIGYTPITFNDLAVNPINNILYGVSEDGGLYTINTINATINLVQNLYTQNWTITNLTCSPNGDFYAILGQGNLYKFDLLGSETFIGYTGFNYLPLGDITFYEGQIYYTAGTWDQYYTGMVRTDPNNPSNSTLIDNDCDYGWGLATLTCDPGMYLFIHRSIYRISDDIQQNILVCDDIIPSVARGVSAIIEPISPAPFILETQEDVVAVCDTNAVTLITSAGIGTNPIEFLWQDGSTQPTLFVNQPGEYSVTINWHSCTYTDTINVTFGTSPEVFIGTDTTLCPNESILLEGQNGESYHWQNGDTSQVQLVSNEGVYWVDVTSNNCTTRDSIIVDYDLFTVMSLPPDDSLCFDSSLFLDATTPGANYLWQDGSTEATFEVIENGTYMVDVNLNECYWSDTIIVNFYDCEVSLEMPNVFTPNQDGTNDFVIPVYLNGILKMDFFILNRWGEVVYQCQDLNISWDGRFNGNDCTEGVYFWVAKYTDIYNERGEAHGKIHLLR